GPGRGARERPRLDAGRSGFSDRLANLFRAGVRPGVARPARSPLAAPGSGGCAAAVSPGPPRDGASGGALGRGDDPGGGLPARRCARLDRDGALLAAEGSARDAVAGAGAVPAAVDGGREPRYAEAAVRTESWSAPSPWRLLCWQRHGPAEALVAPLSARYRM